MSVWDELGNGIFRRRYEVLDQNIGLIVGAEEAVVIDTRSHHVHADELRRDIASLTSVPVTEVINTHMHWDHTFGNSRFPKSKIIGHVRCRSRLQRDGEKMRQATIASMPDEWAEPLQDVKIMPPQITFEEEMILMVEDRQIRLSYFGRAHTDSDITVLVDDVLFAGDLIEQGAPPAFGDSYPAEWPRTLEAVLTAAATVWVPGHGDVVDRSFAEHQKDELAEVAGLIKQRQTEDSDGFGESPYSAAVMEQAGSRRDA